MNASLPIVLLLAVPLGAFAQAPPQKERATLGGKAAWRWTDEERIAARRAHADVHPPVAADARVLVNGAGSTPGYTIDGATHPELFLPSELMRRLLRGVSSDAMFRASFRQQYSEAIRRAGFDEHELWAGLDRIGARHAELANRSARLRQEMDVSAPAARRSLEQSADRLSAEVCSARVRALTDARNLFGQERFDRFLYEGVAPGFSLAFAHADEESHVRFLEAGCR